jgi:hypothetical protein
VPNKIIFLGQLYSAVKTIIIHKFYIILNNEAILLESFIHIFSMAGMFCLDSIVDELPSELMSAFWFTTFLLKIGSRVVK